MLYVACPLMAALSEAKRFAAGNIDYCRHVDCLGLIPSGATCGAWLAWGTLRGQLQRRQEGVRRPHVAPEEAGGQQKVRSLPARHGLHASAHQVLH